MTKAFLVGLRTECRRCARFRLNTTHVAQNPTDSSCKLPILVTNSMENTLARSATERLVSLDVFRGLTIAGMVLVNNPGSWSHIYWPLGHASWHGWTPTDLIFPFFLFIVGVSIALALGSRLGKAEASRGLYWKISKRALIIFALGLFLAGFPYGFISARYASWECCNG